MFKYIKFKIEVTFNQITLMNNTYQAVAEIILIQGDNMEIPVE